MVFQITHVKKKNYRVFLLEDYNELQNAIMKQSEAWATPASQLVLAPVGLAAHEKEHLFVIIEAISIKEI